MTEVPRQSDGLWIAYYSDWSEFVVFDSEIKCLRHAVENSMQVVQIALGEGVWGQLR